MELSKEQYAILQHFYKQTKIYIDNLPELGIDKDSTTLYSLLKEGYLKRSDLKPYHSRDVVAAYPTSYTITETGKRAYEDYLAHIAQQEYEQQALQLQTRQTVSSEEAVIVAKEANSISRTSKRISIISLVVSIAAVIVAIVAIFCK